MHCTVCFAAVKRCPREHLMLWLESEDEISWIDIIDIFLASEAQGPWHLCEWCQAGLTQLCATSVDASFHICLKYFTWKIWKVRRIRNMPLLLRAVGILSRYLFLSVNHASVWFCPSRCWWRRHTHRRSNGWRYWHWNKAVWFSTIKVSRIYVAQIGPTI